MIGTFASASRARTTHWLGQRPTPPGGAAARDAAYDEWRCANVETSCSRVESRFAAPFLALAETTGRVAERALRIAQPLSRQGLADLTGTTLETAIRVMTRWSRAGVVATRPDGFLLLDRPRLEALSWS